MKMKENTETNLFKEYNLQWDIDIVLKNYFILDKSEVINLRYKILETMGKFYVKQGE